MSIVMMAEMKPLTPTRRLRSLPAARSVARERPTPKCDQPSSKASLGDTVLKWLPLVATLATLAGGAWAYYQFVLGGLSDWMVNLEVATDVLPYGKDTRLLVVHVKSKNPRPIELDVDKSNGSFTLTVRSVPDGLKPNSTITTDDGNLLATRDLMPDDGYLFLPDAEFDDVVGVIVPTGATVAISARLSRGDDEVVADRFVRVQ